MSIITPHIKVPKKDTEFREELRRITEKMDFYAANFDEVEREAKDVTEFAHELAGVAISVNDHIEKLRTQQNTIVKSINLLRASLTQTLESKKSAKSARLPKPKKLNSPKVLSPRKADLSASSIPIEQDNEENQLPPSSTDGESAQIYAKTHQNIRTLPIEPIEVETEDDEWIKPKKVFKPEIQQEMVSIRKENTVRTEKSKIAKDAQKVLEGGQKRIRSDPKIEETTQATKNTISVPGTIEAKQTLPSDPKTRDQEPTKATGNTAPETSEAKQAARMKKELKKQKEKEKKERKDKQKAEKLAAETEKQNKEAEKRKNLETLVKSSIDHLYGTIAARDVSNDTLQNGGKFIEDRIHYYKRVNDAELVSFYEILLENMCPPVLSIIERAFVVRDSAAECGEKEREVLEEMKNDSRGCARWVVATRDQKRVDILISTYIAVMMSVRFAKHPIPEYLQACPFFMQFHSLWLSFDKTKADRATANNVFMDLAKFNEKNKADQFAVDVYRNLAKIKLRMITEDGCILASSFDNPDHMHTMFFSVLMTAYKYDRM